jgi:hypothetical protein
MNKKLILATANFCGPCQVLKKKIETENLSHLIEVQILEENPNFFKQYLIKSVPKLVRIDGDVVDIFSGWEDIMQQIRAAEIPKQ